MPDSEREGGNTSQADKINASIDVFSVGNQNVATALDRTQLETISRMCYDDYNVDDKNFQPRRDRMSEIYKLFLQKSAPKNWPFEGAANIVYPLITEAVVNFNALAYPAILKDGTPCTYKVIGSDKGTQAAIDPTSGVQLANPKTGEPLFLDTGKKANTGERTSTFMNWQLMKQQPWWQPDTDKLTMIIPAVGCAFRKVFFNPKTNLQENRLVLPQNLVVDVNASCLEDAGRISELFQLYPYEIEENIRSGLYIDFDFGTSQKSLGTNETEGEARASTAGDKDLPHLFIHQYRRMDLDGDGYPEPWCVTIHKETQKVVRIAANFYPEKIMMGMKGIMRIPADIYFVKYGFVPDPTGSIYDLGFGDLLYSQNHVLNTLLNQITDNASISSLGGGFIGRGLRLKGGVTRFRPGEYKQVDSSGASLKDQIVPLPVNEPPRVLFELFQAMLEAGRSLAAMTKAFSEGVPANVAATAALAAVEQSMQPFKAIYKRLYNSLAGEFKLMAECNARYADPMEYMIVTGSDSAQADFSTLIVDVIPVCDPEFAYPMQRLMKAQALTEWKDDIYVDGYKVRKQIFDLMGVEDYDELLVVPQAPPPNPLDMANAANLNAMADYTNSLSKKVMVDLQLAIDKHPALKAKEAASAVKSLADAESKEQEASLSDLASQLNSIEKKIDGNAGARIN